MSALYAHTPNDGNDWHMLQAHLLGVAERARAFAAPLHGSEIGYRLGLWHDIGKAHPQFQRYLEDAAKEIHHRGPDHKGAGASLAKRYLGPAAAMVIQGHHGGLRALRGANSFEAWLQQRENGLAIDEALTLARQALDLREPTSTLSPPTFIKDERSAEFWVRLLFSALVDADFLDTEAHFRPEHAAARGSDVSFAALWEGFEAYHQAEAPDNPESSVNQVRREVYDACLAAANQPSGLFRLTVPTGGGKTRSAMAFALQHAKANNLRQIIVAVPYISITQQTASTYRAIFARPGEMSPVLEHHSGSSWDESDEDDPSKPNEVWKRLAAENWDAPIVVTTTVQLFESLFSNRVSACRKLHRLAQSVVILDEAQALPSQLLNPILDGLRELVENYGTTIVLSTATQPAFENLQVFKNVVQREIVPTYRDHFRQLKRVDYDWRLQEQVSWEQVASWMRESPQTLTIVNTKRDALALLDALDDPDALHLSTLLCGAHRTNVLQQIRDRLAAGAPCRVVSTQVVEAGVDVDFPLVLRALGPLVSIIQAAGRCNREGKLGVRGGRVVIFRPADGGIPPGAYGTSVNETESLLKSGAIDLHDPDAVARYYRNLFGNGASKGSLETDAHGIQQKRKAFDYPEVRKNFTMIEDDTLSVVVLRYPGPDQNRDVLRLLDELREDPASARRVLRKLQPYTVALRRREADRLISAGRITLLLNGALGEWDERYDPVRGLVSDSTTSPDLLVD